QHGEPLEPLVSHLEYDLLGRLSGKSNAETYTRYQYTARNVTVQRTARGKLRAAQLQGVEPEWNEQLSFTLDALGNVQSEENHGGRW
ncbi:hypothetical protein O6471_24685, partial [Salmonella enterica subsp. enterica]